MRDVRCEVKDVSENPKS